MSSRTPKLYNCVQCNEVLEITHKDVKNIYCGNCLRDIGINPTYEIPKKQKKNKAFTCLVCQKTFTTEKCLTEHKYAHARNNDYTCTECGKTFTQIKRLIKHENDHVREKPMICVPCGINFTNLQYLRKHQKIVHGIKPRESIPQNCSSPPRNQDIANSKVKSVPDGSNILKNHFQATDSKKARPKIVLPSIKKAFPFYIRFH